VWSLGIALTAALMTLAWGLARTHAAHRPIALFFSASLIADLVRRALAVVVLGPARAELGLAPYAGGARVVFHIEQAGALWRPAGLAALAAVVLGRRRAKPYAAAWAAGAAILAVSYPAVRGAALARAYLAGDLAALAALAAHGLAWWGRGDRPSITEGSVLVLGLVELAAALAYRQPFGGGWAVAQVVYVIAFAALIVLHLGESSWIWSSSHRSP